MKYLYLLVLLTLSTSASGQTIIGQWETYDDNTKEKKAVIEIYKENNLYFSKIIETFSGKENEVCDKCEGAKKKHHWINHY